MELKNILSAVAAIVCISSTSAVKPEDKVTCYQWQVHQNTRDNNAILVSTSATLLSCLTNCLNLNSRTAPSDTTSTRCYAITFAGTNCWTQYVPKENAQLQLGAAAGLTHYTGSTGPLCPPYMEDNYQINGCNVTTMMGYVAFREQAATIQSGVSSEQACASVCFNSASCVFYSWYSTSNECGLFTSTVTEAHFTKETNSHTGFKGDCDTSLYESCGFKLTSNTQATNHVQVSGVTTFEDCASQCKSRGSACYGFDWSDTASACYHFSKDFSTPKETATGVEHYDRFCGCSASEGNATKPCQTPSSNYVSTFKTDTCKQMLEFYQKRFTSSNTVQANPVLGFPETHDVSAEECVSLMYTSSNGYVAAMYDNGVRPYWLTHRCWLWPSVTGESVVTIATAPSLANQHQYLQIGTACPAFTDVTAPASSVGVCQVKQHPTGTYGMRLLAQETKTGIASATACLEACCADQDCYGCEHDPSNSQCHFYSYVTANMWQAANEVYTVQTTRYTIDRSSCCGS